MTCRSARSHIPLAYGAAWLRLLSVVGCLAVFATPALGIEVVAMYRGSCQVTTGVVLRVDRQQITAMQLDGRVVQIPRYEVVAAAIYPLPALPVQRIIIPEKIYLPMYKFEGFRDGARIPLATGWPIEYNADRIQLLTLNGEDHLIARDDIWGVEVVASPTSWVRRGTSTEARYLLRHPLSMEKCPENVTAGNGRPTVVLPQVTYETPIALKHYHDHLRSGVERIDDYADRQRFYAVPRYYGRRTMLGTWAIFGSRYANVGARQVNFLPVVQDEFSEGPFGFQRVVRSGVAPLPGSLHEEPVAQIYYGLKADYIHFNGFFDPTAPLIGDQYEYAKSHLSAVDDRLIEKGGVEFGFDFSHYSLFLIYVGGNMATRIHDTFVEGSFDISRFGMSAQFDNYKGEFSFGASTVTFGDNKAKENFTALKAALSGPVTPALRLRMQYIFRRLADSLDDTDKRKLMGYDGQSRTVSAQGDFDIDYRWTVYALGSVEAQDAKARDAKSGVSETVSKVYPKVGGGVTISF